MRIGGRMSVENEPAQIAIDTSASGMTEPSLPARIAAKPAPNRIAVLLAFGAIWFIWGSTFLAIRYAVETIPPFYAAGTRHLIAGSLIISWCFIKKLRPTRAQLRASFITGFFFFVGGHGLVHWAQQWVPSGVAALLIATEPIWVFLLADIVDRKWRMNPWLASGVVLGLGGVALLLGKGQFAETRMKTGAIVVLISALSWAVGIIYSRRSKLSGHPLLLSALSLLAGSFMLLVIGTATGEARGFSFSSVTFRSWAALAYLIVFGSLIAFTAYAWLLEYYSPTLVATHTYINPIIAVLIGWLLAGEKLTLNLGIAAAMVIGAVVLVQRGTTLLERS
jgi:drug/metabolite transporter (DMT)-like permease